MRQFGDDHDDELWSLFHENSKVTLLDGHLNEMTVFRHMQSLAEFLTFKGCPVMALPQPQSIPMTITDTILKRSSARSFTPETISREELSTILHCAFGVSRDNVNTDFPRLFRTAPSAGALYPIEPFLFCQFVSELNPGLYHFDGSRSELRLLPAGTDLTRRVRDAFLQPELAAQCSVILIMVAFFARSTFKYGERGYRFVLIEAGHIGQNIALVATALGLSCVMVGGFIDRRIDSLLELDGVSQSVIYTALVGGPRKAITQ